MKKVIFTMIVASLALSSSLVSAADSGNRNGASSRIVRAAAAHPNAVQKGASSVAAHPAAQARMDAVMAARPKANALMLDVQKAGGYTPGN